jgi:UPF0176 protein
LNNVTNISTYKFAPLSGLKPLREELREKCRAWNLKGTILLSREGINLFVAGEDENIDQLIQTLRQVPGLEELTPKRSPSEKQPFTRMLVKIKKEIIAFGVEGIDPSRHTSRKISPKELKTWLDSGKEITLFDTRNDYEIKLGTFQHALPAGINHFREFPQAVERLPEELKEKPIVMFCTGGIRCEKAGPFMEREGFKNVFQLDGGILKYFEECGDKHYEGGCFVFDQRVGVDPSLEESDDKQCFLCLTPLTPEDQKDSRYEIGKSCPYCFKSDEQKMSEVLQERQEAIRRVTTPLPGSQPYDNFRPIKVPAQFDGFTLLDFVSSILSHTPKDQWVSECELGRFLDREKRKVSADHIVRKGERYLHLLPSNSEPDVNADIRIIHEDEAIIVVNKPAPLPVHPSGRFNRNSLQYILSEVYAPAIPRPAHRLDANTTGLVVFARSKHFASLLQPQFNRGEVKKVYLVKVQGHPVQDAFSCDTPIGSDPIELGARDVDVNGLPALTHFKVLERDSDGTALLEARPITGRTNQIRAHLWSLGFPICGDQVYLPNKKIGSKQTHSVGDAPLELHSYKISFTHPKTGKPMEFSCEPELLLHSRHEGRASRDRFNPFESCGVAT